MARAVSISTAMFRAHRALVQQMFDERFVRVLVQSGKGVACWGVLFEKLNDFVPLWTATNDEWSAVIEELGLPQSTGLMPEEAEGAVDADESNTPDEAWAALAHWRLTGERLCERRLAK